MVLKIEVYNEHFAELLKQILTTKLNQLGVSDLA